ncbi:pancreatic lipase-related protein 2-like [Ixodes scapularis]
MKVTGEGHDKGHDLHSEGHGLHEAFTSDVTRVTRVTSNVTREEGGREKEGEGGEGEGPGVMCGSGETPEGKAARFAAAISGALRTLLPGGIWDKILPKIVDSSGDRVCYDYLGCFSATDGLTVPVSFPSSPTSVNTQFELYSRSNTQNAVLLDYKPGSVNKALNQFKQRKPLKFMVPGWLDPAFVRLPTIKALLEKEDVNVILVKWNGGAFNINYIQAAGDTALVGRQMSVLVQNLMSVFPDTVNALDIHVIGDSLGAQVPGFFAKHLKKCNGQIIGRISANEAAAPLFEDTGVFVSYKDAKFVDAIHTTGGDMFPVREIGMFQPIGHVDFYPNNAKRQPGCLLPNFSCGHTHGTFYYQASITNTDCRFTSTPCAGGIAAVQQGNCGTGTGGNGEMGYYSINATGRGIQTLKTKALPGYCISEE